jgi:hypothetical protein
LQFEILRRELELSVGMIRSLLAGISQAEAQVKPSPESWSILEVTCHLHDLEQEDFREHLDFILHRQDEQYHEIDPQIWITERSYNQQIFIEVREKFFAEREKSLTWLDDLPKVDWNVTYTSSFGSMSAGEMFASWIAHDNLHIRQLVELRRHRLEMISEPYPIAYAGDW